MNNAERELLIAIAKALLSLPWIPNYRQEEIEKAIAEVEDCMK